MIKPKTEYQLVEDGDSYKIVITYSTNNEEFLTDIGRYTEIKGFRTKSDAYGYLILINLFK